MGWTVKRTSPRQCGAMEAGRLERQRSVGAYRTMDLAMFAAMVVVFETLLVNAATRWFPGQPYTVSVTPAVTAIVLMRWGPWAALHATLGGAAFCFASGANPGHYLVYVAGNLLGLAALTIRKRLTPEDIREKVSLSLLFGGAVCLLMQLGRAAISVMTGAPCAQALGFFTTDAITLLFTLVIVWIARRLDGIFEDQVHYLLRIHRQEKEEDFDES